MRYKKNKRKLRKILYIITPILCVVASLGIGFSAWNYTGRAGAITARINNVSVGDVIESTPNVELISSSTMNYESSHLSTQGAGPQLSSETAGSVKYNFRLNKKLKRNQILSLDINLKMTGMNSSMYDYCGKDSDKSFIFLDNQGWIKVPTDKKDETGSNGHYTFSNVYDTHHKVNGKLVTQKAQDFHATSSIGNKNTDGSDKGSFFVEFFFTPFGDSKIDNYGILFLDLTIKCGWITI